MQLAKQETPRKEEQSEVTKLRSRCAGLLSYEFIMNIYKFNHYRLITIIIIVQYLPISCPHIIILTNIIIIIIITIIIIIIINYYYYHHNHHLITTIIIAKFVWLFLFSIVVVANVYGNWVTALDTFKELATKILVFDMSFDTQISNMSWDNTKNSERGSTDRKVEFYILGTL